MTLAQAIEQLSFWETRFHDYNDPKMTKAVRLGIEALKWVIDTRNQIPYFENLVLPGETTQ